MTEANIQEAGTNSPGAPPPAPPAEQAVKHAPAKLDTDGKLYVLDTTATPEYPVRTHHMLIDGLPKPFIFKNGEPLLLDIDLALKFLPQEAFLVTDPVSGERFDPNPRSPEAGEEFVLQADEVVARLGELSAEALLLRAKQLPNGEQFKKTTRKSDLVAALTQVRAAKMTRGSAGENAVLDAEGLNTVGELTGGAMSSAQLNKLFSDVG